MHFPIRALSSDSQREERETEAGGGVAEEKLYWGLGRLKWKAGREDAFLSIQR